jgi:glycosyltransferase involved in cell wall biosynthesis
MVRGKGVAELIRAAEQIEGYVKLRLAGEGPERQGLEELVQELGLDSRVSFVGPVLDMPAFWAGCDIAAFPTTGSIESFGLAAVEAMACGNPVVASRSGGFEEVIEDGTTGALVTPGDIEGLANALRLYISDADLRHRHSVEARRLCVRRFDIRDVAARYLELFES